MKEGAFEGQMSGLDFDINNDPALLASPFVPKIDSPPTQIDFKSLPDNVLKSDVIETLISQNEDLMSRLTSALRRAALLDEKVSDARTESTRYKNKYHNLMDQVLVLREQSRVLAERLRGEEHKSQNEQRSYAELEEQLKIVEIRYAELYTSFQKRKSQTEEQIDGLNRKLSRFFKYRKNMQSVIRVFRQSVAALHAKRQQYENSQQTLKHNLDETTAYISQQAKDHRKQLSDLTDSYENQIKNLQKENQMLLQQNQTLGERAQEMDRVFNEKVKIENELIINNRRIEESTMAHAAEISDLQKTVARYRNEALELSVQLDAKLNELQKESSERESLALDNKNLNDQVETLQMLWRDQQNQVEKLSNQKDSLQKLNKELSVAVNEYRREVRDLKEKVEATEYRMMQNQKKHDEQLKIMGASSLRSEDKSILPACDDAAIIREDQLAPDMITKIDKVMSQHLSNSKDN